MNKPSYIIVIGTSAGGLKALSELVTYLKPEMDVAVFIVMHLSTTSVSDFLVVKLQPQTVFKCVRAVEHMDIEQGHIYIAQANVHLLVKDDQVEIGRGPAENRWKPSIDVLFRSAAAAWSNRVIGIVLTGLLDDGTTGMLTIKKSGGVSIVQDPNEAEFPDMPLSVMNSMEVNHCLKLGEIGNLLPSILVTPPAPKIPAPSGILAEAEIAENVVISNAIVEKLGQKSQLACPDCGGGLYEIPETATRSRYRCHIGHAYTELELSLKQNEAIESTLWIALRMIEERKNLLKKMEFRNIENGFRAGAATYHSKALDLEMHIEKLKSLLYQTQDSREVGS